MPGANQDNPALDALNFFVSRFSPATKEDAVHFFSTIEIGKAIAEHTGCMLESSEIYTMLNQMGYSYYTTNNLEFTWLMKNN